MEKRIKIALFLCSLVVLCAILSDLTRFYFLLIAGMILSMAAILVAIWHNPQRFKEFVIECWQVYKQKHF